MLSDQQQVRAVSGLDRTLPFARFELEHLACKIGAEHRRNGQFVDLGKTVTEQQPVADSEVALAILLQIGERSQGVGLRVLPQLRIEVDLLERDLRGGLVECRIGRMELPQLLLGRFGELGGILDQKLQLLRETAPNDGVGLVEAHLLRLPRQQFLVDQFIDEPLDLVGGRLAQPLARPGLLQPAYVARADAHRLAGAGVDRLIGKPGIAAKQHGAGDGEMQQRLLKQVHGTITLSRDSEAS